MTNKPEPYTTPDAQLEHILQLAQEARVLSGGRQWKTSSDEAIERHSEACEALWGELYRLLDERGPIARIGPAPDQARCLRKMVASRLRADLPGIIADLVDEVCLEAAS